MHDVVKSGEIGEIRRVNWLITNWFRTQYYYDSGAWRATWKGEGGGVLLNQCPPSAGSVAVDLRDDAFERARILPFRKMA